jgi:hypothetical protein
VTEAADEKHEGANMTTNMSRTIRRFAAGLLALAALGLAACGSNSSNTTSPAATPTTHATTPASAPTTSSSGSTKNGIPQGPNAGDRDADNSGGPSDGDGNL